MSFPITMLYQPSSTGSLTNTQYIAEFNNILNNMIPESIDDYSANATEMKIQTDPGEVGSESLATTMSEELERLRFAIKENKAMFDSSISYWYETPTANRIKRTTDADVWTIYASNTTFSNTILTLKTDEENSGSFYYLKLISDVDGTPTTDFSVDQDGNVVCGTITSGQISTGTAVVRTTDIELYETTAGTGNAIKLVCPATPTATSFTLPSAAPASTKYMNSTSGGALGFSTADEIAAALTSTGTGSIVATATAANANTLIEKRTRATGASVAVGGVAISSSDSGAYATASTSLSDVTGLTVTIITSGRPVKLQLIGTATLSEVLLDATTSGIGEMVFLRGASALSTQLVETSGTGRVGYAPSAFSHIDDVAAGTYTYKVQAKVDDVSDTLNILQCKLVAYEL